MKIMIKSVKNNNREEVIVNATKSREEARVLLLS